MVTNGLAKRSAQILGLGFPESLDLKCSGRRRIVAQVRRERPKNLGFLRAAILSGTCDDLLTTGVDKRDPAGL